MSINSTAGGARLRRGDDASVPGMHPDTDLGKSVNDEWIEKVHRAGIEPPTQCFTVSGFVSLFSGVDAAKFRPAAA